MGDESAFSNSVIARRLFAALCALPLAAHAGGNLLEPDPVNPTGVIEKKWDDRLSPITWVLSSDGNPQSGMSNSVIIGEFTSAFDSWEGIATSRLDFAYSGEVNRRSSAMDGYNLVTFTDPDIVFPPGVVGLAITYSFNTAVTIDASNNDLDGDGTPDIPNGLYPAGSIFDGDIIFNSSLPYNTAGTNGSLDVRAIALHEIGHFFGLSHSSIDATVMFPFLGADINSARTLKLDDSAFASFFYPQEPEFSSVYGTIGGRVTNGFDGIRVLGAHVYAADSVTGQKLVGAYSLLDGGYAIPIPAGSYFVGIEPLDGDPSALDPQRINQVISTTFDTGFAPELYDANESNVEADSQAAIPVAVVAAAATSGIDLITNTLEVPGIGLALAPGRNYFTFPVSVPADLTAFDLLTALGNASEINALERYNPHSGLFERASYSGGVPSGTDFPVKRGEGYIVYSQTQKAVTFTGTPDCPDISIEAGLNLIGVPCPPATYSAYDLLKSLGDQYEVISVQRYNRDSGGFDVAIYNGSARSGVDFPVINGEAYIAEMTVAKPTVKVPGQGQIFPPAISGLSPGRGVPGSIVLIIGQGFTINATDNLVKFNGVGAQVLFATPTALTVKVPGNATTGPVSVTVDGKESNSMVFEVEQSAIAENPAGDTEIISGQSAQGQITAEGEQDRYTFVALAGTRVTISATAASPGTPDLMLLLEGPSGVLLLSDDDSGPDTDPLINNFAIPETGVHAIVVTSVPGTGTGPYTLQLDIGNISTAPAISILSGDSQSALPGTDLPYPLEVLVTSSTGQALAGVTVSFTATDVGLTTANGGLLVNAGTTSVSTNKNGIATATATLPNTRNAQFNIVVTVPGFPAQTMRVGSIDSLVAELEITGNNQDCGGGGCQVDTALPADYSIRFKDISGNPVNNVFTQWKVVSGGGSLQNFVPAEAPANSGKQTTGADGLARVKHKLGKKVFFDNTKVRIPHAVAVTVPGQPTPILFGSMAKAGPASKMESNKTNFSQMTYNTARLNAIYLTVADQFGNAVKGATVSASGTGGLTVAPGLLNGQFLTNFNTNDDGVWVGMVGAGGVTPTIDEFGGRNSAGLASTYSVNVSVPGVPAATYNVDVDMGPDMVTASIQGDSALITKNLANPVQKWVFRYQRKDTYSPGNGVDTDSGDWRDETNFTASRLRFVPISGVPVKFTAKREDQKKETDEGLSPTKVNNQDTVTVNTDASGIAQVNVKMADVGGVINVLGEITSISVEYHNDSDYQGQDGAVLHDPPLAPNPKVFSDQDKFAESTTLNAIPIVLTIKIDDKNNFLPDQVAGIDLRSLVVAFEGAQNKTLFSGSANPALPLNKFPNFTRILLDGSEQNIWPSGEVVSAGGFADMQIIYQPTGKELVTGTNTVRISGGLKDKVDNAALSSDVTHTFPF